MDILKFLNNFQAIVNPFSFSLYKNTHFYIGYSNGKISWFFEYKGKNFKE